MLFLKCQFKLGRASSKWNRAGSKENLGQFIFFMNFEHCFSGTFTTCEDPKSSLCKAQYRLDMTLAVAEALSLNKPTNLIQINNF